ncbi:hypothetical protein [Reyranella sp.]|uniref:hypothetical protein n=1 Tax=Reyranella sp. TaxID=1929291 RepID=UPI002731E171|nr:hypothetical protein [Reyranella sp.]MDP2374403.1 hypothetical protein [Reyranella sp.]
MTVQKIPPAHDDVARIEDELIQSILDAPGDEIREYLSEIGEDATKISTDVASTIQRAIGMCGQEQLRQAKDELQAWRTQQSDSLFRPLAQRQTIASHLRSASSGIPLMLAARKGKTLSTSDEEGLAEDLEEAERLERDAEKE